MSTPVVLGFAFDDDNEEKFWNHGLTPELVSEVLDWPIAITRNRRNRAAPYLLIGRDEQGQCIAVPVLPTNDPFIWRPVTAWPCKPGEWTKLPKAS